MTSATTKRNVPGTTGTVEVHISHVRDDLGLGAILTMTERRVRNGVVRATVSSVEPLGVDLTRISRFSCERAEREFGSQPP
jgi:hypothetical protein